MLKTIVSIILLQTLFFKFGGASEAIALFSKITNSVPGTPSDESVLRIGTGLVELLAVTLLLLPRFTGWGATLAFGTMLGAIATHLYLGLFDALFAMAIITAIASGILLWMNRYQLPILKKLGNKKQQAKNSTRDYVQNQQ